jgi:hypothetical protein
MDSTLALGAARDALPHVESLIYATASRDGATLCMCMMGTSRICRV